MASRFSLKFVFATILMVYVLSPIIFKYSLFIQRSLLFMNHVNTNFNFNLSQPERADLKCTRLLQLERTISTSSNGGGLSKQNSIVQLGAWHILPQSSLANCYTDHTTNRTSIEEKLAFADSRPVVLYVHGNGGNRAGDHRQRLYRRLAYDHDYHIITFDYRGYGDSTYEQPSVDTLTSDTRFMFDWLLKQKNISKERLIVWGHSLGTAVAVRMVASLPEHTRPSRLVLEAPFDSMANAIANHPFSTPFRMIPYFEYFFVDPIEQSKELNFDSAKSIGNIQTTPIIILHAEDDGILPFKLGQNLYEVAAKKLGKQKVKFIQINGSLGLGHKYICDHDETMSKVKQFVGK